MPFKITGTLNGRVKVRTRKTLGEAAAKARGMQIDAIRDVRVFQDDGQQVDPERLSEITHWAEHLGRVRNLRSWGRALIVQPALIALGFLVYPALILEFWKVFLLFVVCPITASLLCLYFARKIERAGPNPPAATPPSPPAPPALSSPPAPAPRSRPAH